MTDRITVPISRVWLADPRFARGGSVFDVGERPEEFEVEIDVEAIRELVARDAARNKDGRSSQMMGLVRARHIRGGIGLAGEPRGS